MRSSTAESCTSRRVANNVFALDVTTGAHLWSARRRGTSASRRAAACRAGSPMGDGRLYVRQLDDGLSRST